MLVWLVTGCSSGFGEEFVHQIVARGDKVIATGRNAESRLSHLRDTGAAILDLDITTSSEIIKVKVQQTISIFGKIDVLVNNAGYSHCALTEDIG
jgi:NADP-dependent 3-hydroxy acid dehydrogenase YdfG